jgi:spermidine synthase
MQRLSLILCIMFLSCSPAGQRILFQERSDFTLVTVVEEAGNRCLYFGDLADERETCIDQHDPDRSIFEYTALMFVGFLFQPETKSLLLIGVGGGYIPGVLHRHKSEVMVEAVDIDPVVVEVARRYFDLPEYAGLKLHVADGRRFVDESKQQYDQIWLDAFDEDYVPPSLSSQQFLEAAKARLTEGGVLVENLHRSHPSFRAQMATAEAVFERVWVFYGDQSDNAVLVAGNRPAAGLAELLNVAESMGESIGSIDLIRQAGRLSPGASAVGAEVLQD